MDMYNGIEYITEWLKPYMSIYYIIGMWAFGYFIFDICLKHFTKKQKERKKKVLKKIDEIKSPFRQKDEIIKQKEETKQKTIDFFTKYDNFANDKEKWRHFKEVIGNMITNNRMIEALRMEKHLTEEEVAEIQTKSKAAIKEEKSKPVLPLLNFAIRITIFILLLRYFYTIEEIPESTTLVLVTTIVSFLSIVTRKTVMIFLLIAVITYFFYQTLSGAALIFLLFYWILYGIAFRIKQSKKKREVEMEE